MTAMTDTGASVPRHFWAVVLIAILWNGFGAYDYIMSMTGGEDYFRSMGMTDAQIAYMNAYPTWMAAVWALGVWSSVAGTLLLLVRRKWAFHAFAFSLAMVVVSLIYTYGMTDGAAVMTPAITVMQIVVALGCAFFTWYSRLMAQRGVLR